VLAERYGFFPTARKVIKERKRILRASGLRNVLCIFVMRMSDFHSTLKSFYGLIIVKSVRDGFTLEISILSEK
jgi:hypothetical protein